jgi:hypothetical protein
MTADTAVVNPEHLKFDLKTDQLLSGRITIDLQTVVNHITGNISSEETSLWVGLRGVRVGVWL